MRTLLSLLVVFGAAPALLASTALAQGVRDPVDPPAHRSPARNSADQEDDTEGAEYRGWVDVGIGWGRLHLGGARSFDGGSLLLDFTAGRWLSHHVAIGARAGGWTLESFDIGDPREGASLSEVLALLKVRPLRHRPMFATIAGGWASYTANDPVALGLEGDGLGWRAELEWDVGASGPWSLGAALVASWGRIDPDSPAEGEFVYGGGALLVRGRWRW